MKRPPYIKLQLDDNLNVYPNALRQHYNDGRQDMIDFLPDRDEINKLIMSCCEHGEVNKRRLAIELMHRLEIEKL